MGLITESAMVIKINELICVKGLEKCLAPSKCYRVNFKRKKSGGSLHITENVIAISPS